MSLWHTILIAALTLAGAFAALCALLAMLYHVRFEGAWMGMWTGAASLPHEKFARLEHGFPGFMRPLTWSHEPDEDDDVEAVVEEAVEDQDAAAAALKTERDSGAEPSRTETAAPAAATPSPPPTSASGRSHPEALPANALRMPDPDPGKTETTGAGGEGGRRPGVEADRGATASPSSTATPRKTPRRRAAINQYRRALFRFVTDGPAWRLQSGYFLRCARSALRLANVRVEFSAGHPDPAKLGRFAGYWYALSPFLPTRGASMAFRFQDRHPSFGARVTAAFSLFAVARFFARVVLTFPYVRLSRRAVQGWRGRRLEGWRAFVYRKIQTL